MKNTNPTSNMHSPTLGARGFLREEKGEGEGEGEGEDLCLPATID